MFPFLSERQPVAWIGLCTWAVIGLPTVHTMWTEPGALSQTTMRLWLAAFAFFGLALGAAVAVGERGGSVRWGRLLLAVQSASALTMTAIIPCYFSCVVFALIAWQAPLVMPPRAAVLALGVQAVALAAVFAPRHDNPWLGWAGVGSLLGFQALAFIAATVAQREAEARHRLAQVLSELRATQKLLADTSRAAERTRISRELHDVLGHRLVALHLQLDAAERQAEPTARPPLARAREHTQELLRDVREVVKVLRDEERVDVRRAAQACLEGIERPRVHLTWADDVKVADSLRAHALVRCVQEAVTNTLKHAEAENLWLSVRDVGGGVVVEARDDGRGATHFAPGWGLSGMRERLEQVGGTLQVEPGPKRGFTLRAWIPTARGAA